MWGCKNSQHRLHFRWLQQKTWDQQTFVKNWTKSSSSFLMLLRCSKPRGRLLTVWLSRWDYGSGELCSFKTAISTYASPRARQNPLSVTPYNGIIRKYFCPSNLGNPWAWFTLGSGYSEKGFLNRVAWFLYMYFISWLFLSRAGFVSPSPAMPWVISLFLPCSTDTRWLH